MANLSGYWLGDDGCQYYLSQDNNQLWWAGLDNHGWLHDGLLVSNVFFGELFLEPPFIGAPVTEFISGQWFDVPRGPSMSSGYLTLTMEQDPSGEVVAIHRQSASGRFRAAHWQRNSREAGTQDNRFWFDKPFQALDAETWFQYVVKNSSNPLIGDLKPFLDVVVVYGWLRYDDAAKNFRRPYVSQAPDWGVEPQDFFNNNHDGDRDANFDLSVDILALHNHLALTTVPGIPGRDLGIIERKLRWGREHEGQGESRIHCEMVMYGDAGYRGNAVVTPEGEPISGFTLKDIYPGWAQLEGNSILVNGRPVNGDIDIGAPIKDLIVLPELPPIYVDDPVEHELLALKGQILPPDGSYIRVTGVLALDCGHYQYWPPEGSPCYDDPDDDDDMSHGNQEIHPVFAVDIINATPSADLSGAWGADNGDTIYLHQMGQTVMGLRLPAPGAGNGVTVLRCVRRGNELRGAYQRLSPPQAGGEIALEVGDVASVTATASEGNWRKLYDAADQTPTIEIHELNYGACDRRRLLQGREDGTALFTVTMSNFPEDAQFTYIWTASGGHIGDTQEKNVVLESLPAAGTTVTVSVSVKDDLDSEYNASYDFIVLPGLGADEHAWVNLICLLTGLGHIHVPTPVPIPNLPDPPPFEIVQQLREIRMPALTEIRRQLLAAEKLVHQLGLQPRASEGVLEVRTAYSITDVNFHAEALSADEVSLAVEFHIHNNGLGHVAGLVFTTDFWATSRIASAVFQRPGEGFEVWRADASAPGPRVTFEFVIFCDDYGGNDEVPRVWNTNGGRRYRVGT